MDGKDMDLLEGLGHPACCKLHTFEMGLGYEYLFEPYHALIQKADQGFRRMEREFGACIKCEPRCADCCHAVFGLFLIEAVFLKHDFDQLDESYRTPALQRAEAAESAWLKLQGSFEVFKDDPTMIAYTMAKARIRCPLLSDSDECILYPYRPITCRVYGIPCMARGVVRVCGKAGFQADQSYPAFNLDGIHRELYHLSQELLKSCGANDPERASLLISVSKVIQTPPDELIRILPGE